MSTFRRFFAVMSIKNYKKYSNVSYYTGEANTLDDIKTNLASIGKGSVDLTLHDDGIASLIINNPEKKNAFSGKMMVDLSRAVEELEKWDDGKAILVSGAPGGGFCSGGDLEFVRSSASPQLGVDMSTFMTSTLIRLKQLPLISIAYIQPPGAIGGGAEVSVACDMRLMDPKSKIGFVHSRLAVLPAWGGTGHLIEIVGRSKALRVVSSGMLLSAQEAINLGLVDATVESEQGALEFLREIVTPPTQVVRAAKISVLNSSDMELHGRLFAALFGGNLNKDALNKNLKHRE